MADALAPYRRKRDFAATPEPRGGRPSDGARLFVVQKHAASRLHYDFRLELGGTLKSWAVPKGPSLDPADRRMAVHVEDHPIDYASFEGSIPAGHYGAGDVIVWDRGTWEPIGDAAAGYAAGRLKFRLHGSKLAGGWTLVRMRGRGNERQEPWLLIKERDDAARPAAEYVVTEAEPDSVVTGRGLPERARPARKATATKAATKTAKTATKAATKAAAKTTAKKAAPPAAKARLPATLAPQLAVLASAPPSDGEWLWEIKFDGYRLLARVDGDDVRLVTRNGNDWTARLGGLADAVRALGIGSGWLDGEIVVEGRDGAPDFHALQNAFDAARTERIVYHLFDLPFHDGHDLRGEGVRERRERLRELLDRAPAGAVGARIRYSENFDVAPAEAQELLAHACRLRLEGVIGKRADAPYAGRRAPTWIKLKCTRRQEFVIGGWTDPQGSRTGIGSLLLGYHDDTGQLRFAGGVGSGFDTKTLADLRRRLEAIASDRMPFATPAREVGKGHWVEPVLVAEVSFGEWTPDGRVRHAVFHALRDDKPAAEISREQAVAPAKQAAARPTTARKGAKKAANTATNTAATEAAKAGAGTAAPKAAAPEIGGVRISNPGRVVDGASGATKLDVVNHYLRVARVILPHLAGRPVSLVRAPRGLAGPLVFQRHAETLKIPELKRLDTSVSPDHKPMVEVDSFAALIGAAQHNVVEFHTWNATSDDPTHPDRIVFDLDPGEGLAWKRMREGAELLHALLDELGLPVLLKTSGGKGLHVVVPVDTRRGPELDPDGAKAFARAVVQRLADTLPDRFVVKSGPKNRVGRIFVDYLRNGTGATTVCAWSVRARPGLGVSVPCDWSELGSIGSGDQWRIGDLEARLEEHGDPWHRALQKKRPTLARAMRALGVSG